MSALVPFVLTGPLSALHFGCWGFVAALSAVLAEILGRLYFGILGFWAFWEIGHFGRNSPKSKQVTR
jgi:hypothetical protein